MPYLRCETCGARALSIATRCPACEAPFELGSGTSDPEASRKRLNGLRPCRACDSLIASNSEQCRWCEAPRPIRSGGARWFMLAVVLLGVGVGVWALAPHIGSFDGRLTPVRDAGIIGDPVSDDPADPAGPDDAADPASVGAAEPSPLPPLEASLGGVTSNALASNAVAFDSPLTPANPVRAPNAVRTPEPAPPALEGWVRAVTRTFVNVRTGPGTEAAIVGVLSENTSVQLGPRRGAWREVRAGQLVGWAFEPLFIVDGG